MTGVGRPGHALSGMVLATEKGKRTRILSTRPQPLHTHCSAFEPHASYPGPSYLRFLNRENFRQHRNLLHKGSDS